ncbi:imm11 family protein [Pyxidicoccus sp. 3LFB2]
MSQRFFRLNNDAGSPGRWHLDNPTDSEGRELDDSWQFTDGRPVHVPGRLKVPVEQPGRPLDFTLAGLAIPVVHVRVASVLTERAPADVQLVPVDIDGQPDQYLLFVATRLIRCIDEQASRIRLRDAEEGPPERGWQYASVRDLRIDKSKVGDAKVFRTEGWNIALVVSDDIKTALEQLGTTGVKFEEV